MGLTRTTRWLATALALLAVGCAHAADDDLTSSTTSLAGNGTISLTPEVLGPLLVQTIQTNLAVGQRRLIVMRGMPPAIQNNCPLICNGAAAIVTHTPTLKSNGECFKDSSMPSLASDLSCTCLTYLPAEEWTFKISKSTFSNETYPPLISSIDEVIALDSMMIYGVGPSVETLNLIGVGDSPIKIQFMPSPIQGASTTEPAIVISALASNLTALRVENLAIDGEIGKGFVPSALTNLTMKNCMIRTFKSELFASLLGKLKSLDLSGNLLSGVYQDITDKTCVAQICNITSMNLSSNDITTMPSYLLNLNKLTSLSLRNNPINFTVDTTTFASLERLSVLDIDEVQNCSAGQLEVLGSTKLCVYNATTAATPTPASSTSDGGGGTSYLIYVVIGGCLVIVVLAFLLVKRNSWRSRSDDGDFTKEPLDAYFDNTLAYDDTHPTVSASLLNDPIIITHRLPYKDLRVANCISKGGFGLVYSGVYNRRRVAIKKIRPDRAGDIKQIESFLKEICLMATLNHPRIVEFVGVSWDSLRNLCAVTEFMERGDLREVLHGFKLRNTPLTWESNKTAIALHIAEGLTYLHSLSPKVIHRDLKSKNVLLNGEMTAKLSDFGISRERNIEETHMTAGIGTSFWIAPEVLLGKDYDEHADIFSFGVVLSEIDTDDYPYWNASNPNVGNKAQENMILQMVASGAMRPSFSDTCPKAILELADLCLQVEPENRPTAAEVAYKLQQIVAFMNPPSSSGGRVV